jgi:hypothetical protein
MMFTLELNFEVDDGRRRGRWDGGVPCGLGALFSLQRRTLDPLRRMTPWFPPAGARKSVVGLELRVRSLATHMASLPQSTRAVTTETLMSADLPERRGSRHSERMGNATTTTVALQAHHQRWHCGHRLAAAPRGPEFPGSSRHSWCDQGKWCITQSAASIAAQGPSPPPCPAI